MKKKTWILVMTAAGALLAIAGCSGTAKLKGVKVARASVESTVSTTSSGTIEAEQQATLNFSATGRIAGINVRLGDRVKQGQVLASLENSDLQTVFLDAQKEAKRAQELYSSGLVSKVALDDARRSLEIARANLDRTIIRAPFDGVVTEQNLELGELSAQPGTTATPKAPIQLIDMKPRIIKGQIDEVDLAKVHVGQRARVKILAIRQEPFPAVVTRVVPYVSTTKEQDRTSEIELHLVSPEGTAADGLPPEKIPVGASADVEVIVSAKSGVPALPSRVVLGGADNRYVFRFDGKRIHKVAIKTGIGNYDRTEILSGLGEGDIAVYPSDDVELKDGLKAEVTLTPWP